MNDKQKKFENPVRLQELNPVETLKKIGFGENDVLCDIGAGTGIFTIPAAKITENTVYALELSDEMLSIIDEKAKTEGINNIELIQVNDDRFDLADDIADLALMVTVLHEIRNVDVLLEEVKRMLKEQGKFVVIEFHKHQTPMGPPVERRLGQDEVKEKLINTGFTLNQEFVLGENYYCLVFEK